jgi:adenylate cyclase
VNISITSEMQLEVLLTKIVQVTSKVIHADRTSLFLHDDETGELWSVVAEGVRERQIRFPVDRASPVRVHHRAAVNLTTPMRSTLQPRGRRRDRLPDAERPGRTGDRPRRPAGLGVMQALNRQDGPRFGEADVERMAAFAAQAAVAIDNATLFSEVAAERNYNESILRSMSSGVVTLDPEVKVAKLNIAAAKILQIPIERLEGADVRAWLEASNPRCWPRSTRWRPAASPRPCWTPTSAPAAARRCRPTSRSCRWRATAGPRHPDPRGQHHRGQTHAGRHAPLHEPAGGGPGHGARGRQPAVRRRLPGERLFADIRNFTSLAETLQPRETVDMLNEIFTELVEAVAASDGVLDKFLGDAIMAVYGAPLSSGRDPQNAVESALAMMRLVESLNQRRSQRGPRGVAAGDRRRHRRHGRRAPSVR